MKDHDFSHTKHRSLCPWDNQERELRKGFFRAEIAVLAEGKKHLLGELCAKNCFSWWLRAPAIAFGLRFPNRLSRL